MKLNKKTNKVILQKKDCNDLLIYKDGYISNGNWLVKEDYFEFESDLLQDKLNKKENFCLYLGNNANIPSIEHIIKTPEGEPVRITKLLFKDDFEKINYSLLTNLGNNQTIVMNEDYTEIIKLLNGNVTQQINRDYQPITVYKDGSLIGVFMPIINRVLGDEINQFIIDNMTNEQYKKIA